MLSRKTAEATSIPLIGTLAGPVRFFHVGFFKLDEILVRQCRTLAKGGHVRPQIVNSNLTSVPSIVVTPRARGQGHLYQGRYKSFAIQDDEHFLTVCRYVQRNALRAGIVARAEQWRWSSLWRRLPRPEHDPKLLTHWPIPRLPGWVDRVNKPLTENELKAVRRSSERGAPLGDQ